VSHFFHQALAFGKNPVVLVTLMSLSAASFVVSIIGVPWYVKRLPEDYFSRREQEKLGIERQPRTLWDSTLIVLQNVVGAMLVFAGLAMLILPGQGLLTLLVGVLMMDFPGKRRIQRRVLAIPSVLKAVNTLRQRSGEPPLIVEFDEAVPSVMPPRSERPRSAH
jgi:Putative transmembrane protein (PGPGW)